MKTSKRTLQLLALFTIGVSLTFTSCKKSDNETTPTTENGSDFAIIGEVSNPAGAYVLTAGTLNSGSVSADGNGVEISGWSRLFKNGFYYNIDNGKFIKYKYERTGLTKVSELTVTGAVLYAYWLNDNTLFISGGTSSAATPITNYTIINVETMTITKQGTLGNQPLGATDKGLYVSGVVLNGSKLYVSYTLYNSGWTATDTAYLASVDYPAMSNLVISKDVRTTYMGSFASVMPGSLTYNNDIYMISNTGDRWGVNAKPAAIMKIKSGETAFDTSYFFDLSAISNGNREYYGLWDLGNGKAITRMGRTDLLLTFTDYFSSDVFEYYVIDFINKTRTKIDIPLDKGTLVSPVWVENGKAYISNSSSTAGHYVYTYDIASGSVTKGLEIKGVDLANWLYRLN